MRALLLALAVAFAVSLGAHYTGACMGMPHALRAVRTRTALLVMAPLALLGAAFASHGVENTVAHRVTTRPLTVAAELVVVGMAFGLTSVFNRLRVPTSTIQILVFCLAGTALAEGEPVRWSVIGLLAVVWVSAPVAAALLGYALTMLMDRLPGVRSAPEASAGRGLAVALVAAGAAASFVMGANDVANATGSLVGTRMFGPLAAGAIGGGGIFVGVLTWGRPLLQRVAFEIVRLDRAMATAAQAVQALVVVVAVAFGLFTSMNQALVGAMAGTGAARDRRTINTKVLLSILAGWVVGPAAGITGSYVLAKATGA